jgi:catalase
MAGTADTIEPAMTPFDMEPSPALSLIKKATPTLKGRKIAVLVTDGVDAMIVDQLREAVTAAGAVMAVVAPKVGGVKTKQGKKLPADHALSGAPSVLFDAIAICSSAEGAKLLCVEAAAVDFVRDAFGHLKVIAVVDEAGPLMDKAQVVPDEGIIFLSKTNGTKAFITAAKKHRVWPRELSVRSPG